MPTVSMSVLFPECAKILADTMRPWQYAELTDAALLRLSVVVTGRQLARVREDVREKMLEAGRFGSVYFGNPLCLAALEHWFPSKQKLLCNPVTEILRIPGCAACCEEAIEEALLRSPHMLTKTRAPLEKVMRGRARGIVVEAHVKQWFRETFPDFFEEPKNYRQYTQWSNHDFRLELPGHSWEVDVMNPRGSETDEYWAPAGKQTADLHIMARRDGSAVVIEGFQPGDKLKENFGIGETLPLSWLVVRLNCAVVGIDYWSLKRAVNGRRVRVGRQPVRV